jgi:ankyrin repeat protein
MALNREEQSVLDNLLLEAVKKGDLEHVRLYADKGADVNAKFESGDSSRMRPLFLFVPTDNFPVAVADELLARGVNVDTPDYDGETALHMAVNAGSLYRVRYLVGKGANPLAKSDRGTIVLEAARRKQTGDTYRQEIIDTLVNALETVALESRRPPANDVSSRETGATAPAEPSHDSLVEAAHDVQTLRPLELTRRKKNGGGLHL